MNDLAALFAQNPLELPHTDEQLDEIIRYFRARRQQHLETGTKPGRAKIADKAPAPQGKIDLGDLDV